MLCHLGTASPGVTVSPVALPPEASAQTLPPVCLGCRRIRQPPDPRPLRGTHHPLGHGGSAGFASSRPGWDSGWRPGVGQLTSMWSHSCQNPHCSQKSHPGQTQKVGVQQGWAFVGLEAASGWTLRPVGIRKCPEGPREPPDLVERAGWRSCCPWKRLGSDSCRGRCL